jgi:hypothetical protein
MSKAWLADKYYRGDRSHKSMLIQAILPIILPRLIRKITEHPDYRRYLDHNRVERILGRL